MKRLQVKKLHHKMNRIVCAESERKKRAEQLVELKIRYYVNCYLSVCFPYILSISKANKQKDTSGF